MVKRTDGPSITLERLRSLVSYDPETGDFASVASRGGIRHSASLGHVEENGYRRLMIDGRRYLAHRLAWFFVTGEWPAEGVDHKNGDRDDNRWANLRLATASQNQANRRKPRGYSCPLKGAHWNRFRSVWQSYIRVQGRSLYLGRFDTPEAAHAAYAAAATLHFGEYARAA